MESFGGSVASDTVASLAMIGLEGRGEGLSVLHQRLEGHFTALRSHRDQAAGAGVPLFALEHGLDDGQLSLLKLTVAEAVQRQYLSPSAWLPYVVYAAEIGYEYCGDEYWQTFASRTPGWPDDNGSRDFIRSSFRKFAQQFGGARPSGAWAGHFRIICWPITHAVLPTDLQRHLAQLLHDYRMALTSELLADPPKLGARLATRTLSFSSRFQNFAQNAPLLGQVAAALYLGTEEESPYLLTSTLTRIVETLSSQREAKLWLRDARRSASTVRARGFVKPASPKQTAADSRGSTPVRLPNPTDPEIVLHGSDLGWQAHLRLPDLSALAGRLPELHQLLTRRRVRVTGRSGAPLAHRRLLVPGQEVRLDEWPNWRAPLLQFEGDGVDAANRLLDEQCQLSPGPIWLFRIREPGRATEVRGKFIRPGHSYVILAPPDSLGHERPSWIQPAACATNGVSAYAVEVPVPLTNQDLEALQALHLGSIADVAVRPVGLVPKDWDGEGAAEWLAGEDVLLAIRSERAIAKCAVVIDELPRYLDWPDSGNELFIGITGLDIGMHQVHVTLLTPEVDAPAAEGSLLISIRAAHSRPTTGTVREGLMLLANPAQPTLGEVWDGRATIELVGPVDTEVVTSARLEDSKGRVLARTGFKVQLPMQAADWLKTAKKELQGSTTLRSVYDESHVLDLTFSHAGLGAAQLRCERAFSPLRWVLGSDRQGYFARLVNNVEGETIYVSRYAFASPETAEVPTDDSSGRLRWPKGGLLVAEVGDYRSAAILPPQVRDFGDIHVTPFVANAPRTIRRVQDLVALSGVWESAALPSDPFAQHDRRIVLRGLTMRAVTAFSGGRWNHLEESGLRDDQYSFGKLLEGLRDDAYQKGLGEAIQRRVVGWMALEPMKRAEELAGVLAIYHHRTKVKRLDHRFTEFLLRLASDPATLVTWPATEVEANLQRVSDCPVLIRAARFVVLAIHIDEEEDTGTSIFRGWSWA